MVPLKVAVPVRSTHSLYPTSLGQFSVTVVVAQEAAGKKRRNKEMIRIIWLRVRFEVCIGKSFLLV
jgi:hypothetical protein